MKTENEIEAMYIEYVEDTEVSDILESAFYDGFEAALKWVLDKESTDDREPK